MFASMVICDDTYSNKFWLIVGLGMFALGEVNHMEREMCSYLEWRLKIEPSKLKEFESKVRKDVRSPGTYLNYVLPSPAPSPMPSTTPSGAVGPQHPPSFVLGRSISSRKQFSIPPPTTMPPSYNCSSPIYDIPDTRDSYRSITTSPASLMSPPTPPGPEDHNASSFPYGRG